MREREVTDSDLLKERQESDRHITHHKRAHQKAKAALTTRDEFLAIVSHDLRNPLAAVTASAEMLRMNLRQVPMEVADNLALVQIIERNGRLMDRLIQDLLDLERIGVGKMHITKFDHDLRDVITGCAESFQAAALEKKVELTVALPSDKMIASFDPDRMTQVLGNLIGNALKFTPSGGQISITAGDDDDGLEVSVRDSGVGISPAEQGVIFERFSQLRRNDRSGLGLGLYISRWIVEEHDGQLRVESEPGQGSRFYFNLPKGAPALS